AMTNLFDLPFEDEPREDEIKRESRRAPEVPSRPPAPAPAAPAPAARPAPPAPAPAPPAPAAAVRRVLSVSELNANIRDLLEGTLFDVWVEGELSNVKTWQTGHLYFTLKDNAAQIKAVMFRSAVRYLRFKPQDGQHVVARGRLSVYEPKGEYQ